MKNLNKYFCFLLAVSLTAPLTSCMDNVDDPNTEGFMVTCPTDLPAANISIKELKDLYCGEDAYNKSTYHRNSSNWEYKIEDDKVIEGVICLNDGPFGNLYQTLLVRNIEGSKDECIMVAVKHTCLYPFFAIGQRIRINLKGLYVGAYSRVPRVGYPYFTSAGNHNLGPIPFEMCATNFQLIGTPDPTLPECQPKDLTGAEGYNWLRATANRNIDNFPTIATVEGTFDAGDDVSILAPKDIQDDGYGVNRDFKLSTTASGNTTKIIVRTSTGNEISSIVMPKDKTVRLTGMLTYSSYDSKWQINLRDTTDFVILDK